MRLVGRGFSDKKFLCEFKAIATDLNGDHIPDILVSGTRRTKADPPGPGTYGRARLFINDGTGRFREADSTTFTMRSAKIFGRGLQASLKIPRSRSYQLIRFAG